MANVGDDNDSVSPFSSRKLLFSLFSMLLIAGMWAATNRFPGLSAQFPTAIGGILAVLASYLGGNLSHHWISTKFGIPDGGDDSTVTASTTTQSVVSTPTAAVANTTTETKTVVKAPVATEPAAAGSLTITKDSPADAQGEPDDVAE